MYAAKYFTALSAQLFAYIKNEVFSLKELHMHTAGGVWGMEY